MGEMYYQCVYIRMTPSPQLAKAHEMAAAAFGVPSGNGPGKPYMPHLSLVYGDSFSAEAGSPRAESYEPRGCDPGVERDARFQQPVNL